MERPSGVKGAQFPEAQQDCVQFARAPIHSPHSEEHTKVEGFGSENMQQRQVVSETPVDIHSPASTEGELIEELSSPSGDARIYPFVVKNFYTCQNCQEIFESPELDLIIPGEFPLCQNCKRWNR